MRFPLLHCPKPRSSHFETDLRAETKEKKFGDQKERSREPGRAA